MRRRAKRAAVAAATWMWTLLIRVLERVAGPRP
jgi:hypothetical protein